MNLHSAVSTERESRGFPTLLAHLGCSKPWELLQQQQGDAQAWGCSGCLHSHCATWKWFLLSSGNSRIISTPLLTLVGIAPPPRNTVPVAKTVCRRACMSNWQNWASRESGTFTVSHGSQAPAKRAFKTSMLRFEVGKKPTHWQRQDRKSMPLIVRCLKASIKQCSHSKTVLQNKRSTLSGFKGLPLDIK